MLDHFRNSWLSRLPKASWLSPQLLIKHAWQTIDCSPHNCTYLSHHFSKGQGGCPAAKKEMRTAGCLSFPQTEIQRSLSKEPSHKELELCKLSNTLNRKSSLGPALQTNMASENWAKSPSQLYPKYRGDRRRQRYLMVQTKSSVGSVRVLHFWLVFDCMFSLPVTCLTLQMFS